MATSSQYDVAIVGGGVVGCAILHELTARGLKCVLCEKDQDILSGASSGNSGTLHTGFDAPLNSLELECLQRTKDLNEKFFVTNHIPYRVSGAFVVAWSKEDLEKLPDIVAKAYKCGVLDVRQISASELVSKEPHLNSSALGAVHIPRETIVDPWLFPASIAHLAISQGGAIFTKCKVETGKALDDGWELTTSSKGPILAKLVINCAGLFGDYVEAINRQPPFTIKPRKGQYAVFSQSAKSLLSSIIFPVPTERTKGVLLFPSVYGNIVVGPTAEDQSDRTKAKIDQGVIDNLIERACYMLPAIKEHEIVGTYVGLRPATEHKDYQIEAMFDKNWITVGGIRSTGLSACLGIAKRVASLLPPKFQTKESLLKSGGTAERLARRMYCGIDESITYAGKKWKITHPLTKFGVMTCDGSSKLNSHLI